MSKCVKKIDLLIGCVPKTSQITDVRFDCAAGILEIEQTNEDGVVTTFTQPICRIEISDSDDTDGVITLTDITGLDWPVVSNLCDAIASTNDFGYFAGDTTHDPDLRFYLYNALTGQCDIRQLTPYPVVNSPDGTVTVSPIINTLTGQTTFNLSAAVDINIDNISYDPTTHSLIIVETDGDIHSVDLSDLIDPQTLTVLRNTTDGTGALEYLDEDGVSNIVLPAYTRVNSPDSSVSVTSSVHPVTGVTTFHLSSTIDINVDNLSYDAATKSIILIETDGTVHTINVSDLVDTTHMANGECTLVSGTGSISDPFIVDVDLCSAPFASQAVVDAATIVTTIACVDGEKRRIPYVPPYVPPSPPPTASVSVNDGQDADDVRASLSGVSAPGCPAPGITSATWTLYDGSISIIASETDLPGIITLPDLTSETGPFRLDYQVTDSCGTSSIAQAFFTVITCAEIVGAANNRLRRRYYAADQAAYLSGPGGGPTHPNQFHSTWGLPGGVSLLTQHLEITSAGFDAIFTDTGANGEPRLGPTPLSVGPPSVAEIVSSTSSTVFDFDVDLSSITAQAELVMFTGSIYAPCDFSGNMRFRYGSSLATVEAKIWVWEDSQPGAIGTEDDSAYFAQDFVASPIPLVQQIANVSVTPAGKTGLAFAVWDARGASSGNLQVSLTGVGGPWIDLVTAADISGAGLTINSV